MNKSSLVIFPKIVCRTPVFSLECVFEDKWESLKQLIEDSSPEFYELIKDFNASEIAEQSFKIRYTIWKYWNRARYRSTPFGRFAALVLLPVNSSSDGAPIQVSRKMSHKRFVSWKNISHLDASGKSIRQNATFFTSNSSFYTVRNEIRYIYNDSGTFLLTSVELQDALLQILQYCVPKRSKEDVYRRLSDLFHFNECENDDLIEQLIEMQLLMTDRHPNIIGRDYFQRIGFSGGETASTYTIHERHLISGGISSHKFEHLKELIPLLARISPVTDNPDLAKFKRDFLKRYEHRMEVPLLGALDPEIGVGYLSLDNISSENSLISEILSAIERDAGLPEIVYSDLHKFLLRNLGNKTPIRLEEMKANIKIDHSPHLPSTFSALIQMTEDLIVLKQVGGTTANAMIGRFTLLNEDFEMLGKEIADFEQNENSDVLFFDIGYAADSQVDDVNRRKQLYQYELPILTSSEGRDTLHLNDIMISVRNNQIVLRSKKHNRRVVPRLATAYNYKRSELSVFRFLSDLQHQGLQTNLTMNIETLLPYLPYYPRIIYKDIVVSPSKWLIPEHFYEKVQDKSEKLRELKTWLTKSGVDGPFLCGRNDQKLCFAPSQDVDLLFFLQFLRNKEDLYIEESFLHGDSAVRDERNRPYLSEFVVNLGYGGPVYSSDLPLKHDYSESVNPEVHFVQGSKWLYLKIYCHPNRSNELFLNVLQRTLEEHKTKIEKWFFIRFLDPDYHIRLRVKLKDRCDFSTLLNALQDELQPYANAGTVRDIQIAIYNREIERYPIDSIDKIEDVFSFDSSFSLRILQENLASEHLYTISINLLIETLNKIEMSLTDQRRFLKEMVKHFSNEHELKTAVYKKINNHFRTFQEIYSNSQPIEFLKETLSVLVDEYSAVLLRSGSEERQKLIADIFHMHVNRLYVENQRTHELILYEFALKILKMKMFSS